jgi:NAD(P)H dehydrogenase (quinone)
MADLLVIDGHPDALSFNAALAAAYTEGASALGSVERIALRDLDFDPILHGGYRALQALEPDLERVVRAVESAAHVAWIFPLWWNGAPALVKGFVERVFLPGWAFSYGDGGGLPQKLLRGRSARLLSTMDGPRAWHWLVDRNAHETAFARSTLRFVGFAPVRVSMFYGVGKLDAAAREGVLSSVYRLGGDDARQRRREPELAASAGV